MCICTVLTWTYHIVHLLLLLLLLLVPAGVP
jgi:hypothetical protein